jgi:N-terminal domain of unknown function (DUF4140)
LNFARLGQTHAAQDAAKDQKQDQKITASKIVKVVVYPNSALVTREVEVPEGEGLTELVVSPLPPQAISSSLYSEGTNGLRVLSTRFRTRQIFEDSREEVRKAMTVPVSLITFPTCFRFLHATTNNSWK